jgi:hypothetical protein
MTATTSETENTSTATIDESVWKGVRNLLDDYIKVRDDDTFVIAYTPDSREPAAWIALTLKHLGFRPGILAMRPLRDDTFAERLDALLPAPDALPGRLVVITVEQSTMSHFGILRPRYERYPEGRCQMVRIISAGPDFFATSMRLGPEYLSSANAELLNRMKDARSLRIETRGGTDLRVRLAPDRYRWVSNRGVWRPGAFTILPAGEVATYPDSVDGVLVADGAFNANIFTKHDSRLGETPVRVELKDGEVVSYSCANERTRELIRLCFARPYGSNIGELGFGTNTGIDRFIAMNSHVNERRAGIHIGFGQHNQSLKVIPYIAETHLDLITSGARIWVDGDSEPIDLETFRPTGRVHPDDVIDEDLDGDCCGFEIGELRALACPTNDRGQ